MSKSENTDVNDLHIVVECAIAGDTSAIERLVQITNPRMRSYIYRSTLDQDVTDDIVQEVYCKMLRSISALKDPRAFWGWCYRIASNCVKTHYRNKSKHIRSQNLQDNILELIAADDSSAEAQLLSEELVGAVMESFAYLNRRDRQVIALRCFEDMSFDEIGEIENINTMQSRLVFHRAIKKLRILLRKRGFKTASILFVITLFGRATSVCKADAMATTVKTFEYFRYDRRCRRGDRSQTYRLRGNGNALLRSDSGGVIVYLRRCHLFKSSRADAFQRQKRALYRSGGNAGNRSGSRCRCSNKFIP